MCKALNALTCLAELGLLQKPTLQELVSEIVPFLCHPVSQTTDKMRSCAIDVFTDKVTLIDFIP